MGSSAQLLRKGPPQRNDAICISDFIRLVRPLGFQLEYEDDMALYIWHEERWKGIRVYLGEENEPVFTINGDDYYCKAYFEAVYNDEEVVNSDILLAIVMAYMEQYPDTLFHNEDHREPFFDKTDIEAVTAQPFQPGWYYRMPTHLQSEPTDRFLSKWTVKGLT